MQGMKKSMENVEGRRVANTRGKEGRRENRDDEMYVHSCHRSETFVPSNIPKL
jgi:hypothetical protein